MVDFPVTALTIISHLLYNLFSTGFTLHFLSTIYQKKYPEKAPYVIGFIASFLLVCGVNVLENPILNAITAFTIVNVLCFSLYKAKPNPAIFYNLILIMMFMISETAAIVFTSIGSDKNIETGFNFSETESAVGLLASTVLCFALLRIGSIIVSKRAATKIGRGEIIILIFMLLFEGFLFNYMIGTAESMQHLSVLLATIFGFFALNVIVVYGIHQISVLYRLKYETDIIKQQNALQITHYNEMMDNYIHYRRLVHDIRKHMTILTEITAAGNEHYNDYAAALNEKMDMLFDEFQTKSPILSIVMTQKIRAAKTNGIKLVLRVEDVDISFMDNIDITALFANLWDNAIEACLILPPPARVINVSLLRRDEIIIIQFENSFDGKYKFDGIPDNTPMVSTKGDGHAGLGLSIIKAVAKKYSGHFIVKTADQIFTATVMISQDSPENPTENSVEN
jgi:signal transduction histidine kinase